MKTGRTVVAACLALMTAAAMAQADGDALRSTARKALAHNPDVASRQNALRAADDAIDVARGPLYPRVDLETSVGHSADRIGTRTPSGESLTRSGIALSLNQLVWDGLATMNDTRRAGHDRLTRAFELVDTAEQTALEAARAVYDVLRYRRLVQLAEDNYVQHKLAQAQIQQRFQAGVGRGVDMEQVGARVALAEANLTAELANLHDVAARYQRIVGEPPPADLQMPMPLNHNLPSSADAAVATAIERSPTVSASIENLRAQRSIAHIRDAAFQPRVEARLRSGSGRNFDGVPDQKRDTSAELVLNWNLFNGGADRSRVRQQANLVSQAADLRDRACRDARQTAEIAYNDTTKFAEQLQALDRNALAIEKARDAYRQQFVIGQRSLLDLLNAENELYTAKRSYANAEYDLGIAYLRTQAATLQLLPGLGLNPSDTGLAQVNIDGWDRGDDQPSRCPAQPVLVTSTSRTQLDARAQQLQHQVPLAPPPASAPARP